jgi:dTDP-4-dehydrorhamnose 3,5-epimerase-like enzyme
MKSVEFIDLKPDGSFDDRGWAVNPIPDTWITEERFGHIHVASLAPGAVRGNHYHERSTEYLYVYGGSYKFLYSENGIIQSRIFNEKELVGIKINTGTAHSVKNTDKVTIYAVAYNDMPYDFDNPDTKTKVLI